MFEILENLPDTHTQTRVGDCAGFIQASLCKTFHGLLKTLLFGFQGLQVYVKYFTC